VSFHHSNEKPFVLYTWEGPLPSLIFWPTPLRYCQATTLKLGETLGSKPSFTHIVLQDSFLSFVFESTSPHTRCICQLKKPSHPDHCTLYSGDGFWNIIGWVTCSWGIPLIFQVMASKLGGPEELWSPH